MMVYRCLAGLVVAAFVASPVLAFENDPYDASGAQTQVMELPHSPIPSDEAALALPEPETEAIAPYAEHGCRRGQTVYLTN
ncbi:MAG: hypothetical protein KDK89_04895 [Alphaproteobacteria bacterium]|nr:hypothetical protein [Alphaproteobacteria bacterium]